LFIDGLENKKYKKLVIALPLVLLAFMTRITGALMVFPILFYYIVTSGKKKEENLEDYRKKVFNIIKGIFVSILIFIPYGYFYFSKFNNPFFHLRVGMSPSLESIPIRESGYGVYLQLDYYIKYLIYLVSNNPISSQILIAFAALGIIVVFARIFINKNIEIGKAFLVIILISAAVYVFFNLRLLYCLIALFALMLVLFRLKTERDEKFLFDLTMFVWLGLFFIAHSKLSIKVERYYITMAPVVAYFIMRGADVLNQFIVKQLNKDTAKEGFTLLLFLFLSAFVMVSCLGFINNPPKETYRWKNFPTERPDMHNAKEAAEWLKSKYSDYSQLTLYSDIWPYVSWYLQSEVKPMPDFKDTRAIEQELIKNEVDYYFSLTTKLLHNYQRTKMIDFNGIPFFVYEKKKEMPEILKRCYFIGSGWSNYLEDVLSFEYFVYFHRGVYVDDLRENFIDTYSLEELQKYPVLALYNIKWRNWGKTQKLLRDYLEAGGSIIFDASGNMGEIQYSLSETVFFGKMIERVEAEKNAIIEVVNPSLQGITVNPGEFINENGSSWYGTIYTSLENIDKFDEEILATIDGRPLIIKQKIGKGNLFWFSSNFIWHAFLNENMSELNLIKKTFDIAYDSSMGNN
ncbi:MAG: hypothetical protein KAS39_04585, partial [Actinomycetia bacterium]|nr:hypothetical protein [Actinomycetes bacterium]